MSDYTRAELTGPSETLELTPADTELLIQALSYELDTLERLLERAVPGDVQPDPLTLYAAHLAELRDAIHSVVTDPLEDVEPSPNDPIP